MSSYLKFLILSLHLGEKHTGKDFLKNIQVVRDNFKYSKKGDG